jgi:hypothetical protein
MRYSATCSLGMDDFKRKTGNFTLGLFYSDVNHHLTKMFFFNGIKNNNGRKLYPILIKGKFGMR